MPSVELESRSVLLWAMFSILIGLYLQTFVSDFGGGDGGESMEVRAEELKGCCVDGFVMGSAVGEL